MKIKQIRMWCTENTKLPAEYKHNYYRCKCGKRLKVYNFYPDYSFPNKKIGYKGLLLWKQINRHKTKVEYKNVRN